MRSFLLLFIIVVVLGLGEASKSSGWGDRWWRRRHNRHVKSWSDGSNDGDFNFRNDYRSNRINNGDGIVFYDN
jgi:hypothetical protein